MEKASQPGKATDTELSGLREPTVRVAAVQCSSRMGTAAAVDANLHKMEELAREAAAGGAKIIVFPEAALTGYTSQAFLHNWHVPGRRLETRFAGIDPADIVPSVDSDAIRKLAALAKELGVYMTIPFVEKVSAGDTGAELELPLRQPTYFNTVCLASPSGEIVVHYRKTHLWEYVDSSWATRGREPGFVDTEYGRVGLGICYDIHRLADLYAGAGLWTLLYSVAWVGHEVKGPTERWFRKDLPEAYLGHGALSCYVIAANWSTDQEYKWDGAGFSSIYDPSGQRLAFINEDVGDKVLFQDLPCSHHVSTRHNQMNDAHGSSTEALNSHFCGAV